MTRDDLMALAAKYRQKDKPLSPKQKEALRADIAAALTAPEVERAPRIFDDSGVRPMTLNDAVDALMEEVT